VTGVSVAPRSPGATFDEQPPTSMPVSSQTSPSVGDLTGGFASAIVSITGNVAAGVIAFAPLGPDFVGFGILAGMFSSIVAGLLCALSGGAPGMISGPKATTAMAFAAMLSTLLATGRFDLATSDGTELLLSVAFGAVVLSGSVQVLLGAFRVGGLVEFMPYPVVAGIRNTTAILLITGQFWTFVGVPRQAWVEFLADLGQIQPATVLVSTGTLVVAWKGGRFLPKPAVPVAALLMGAVLHHGFAALTEGVRLGAVLGSLPSAVPSPSLALPILASIPAMLDSTLLVAILTGALAMAVLDSISAMISLVSYQSIADRRFDANRQLLAQGIGSAVGAVFGGLTTSGILARAAVNYRAGGRTKWSGVVNALGVLILVVVLSRPLEMLPKAAIAGLIMVIASSLFDRWSMQQVREALRPDARNRRDKVLASIQMGFVVVVGVTVNLVAAVGAGILLSIAVFVAQMTRSPIRRIRTGETLRSARQRAPQTARILTEQGRRIVVVEVEGTIFFGTAEALATRAEALADEGADFLVLDMKRVQGVDATGLKVLGQTFARLRKRGATLGFSYVSPGVLRSEIAEDLEANGIPDARMWPSTDRALEYFEDALLVKLGVDESDEEGWSLTLFVREWGLSEEQCDRLSAYVVERRFEGGEVLFSQGDTERAMYMIRSGAADVSVRSPDDDLEHRVSTAARGTVLGEIALLDGNPRSASATATSPMSVYELTFDSFERLLREEPAIGLRVLSGVAEILGERLRRASRLIGELEA